MATFNRAQFKAQFDTAVNAAAAAAVTLWQTIDRHVDGTADTADNYVPAAFAEYGSKYNVMSCGVANAVLERAAEALRHTLSDNGKYAYRQEYAALRQADVRRHDIEDMARALYAEVRQAMARLFNHCMTEVSEDTAAEAGKRIRHAVIDAAEAYKAYIACGAVYYDIEYAIGIARVSEEYIETMSTAELRLSSMPPVTPPLYGTYLEKLPHAQLAIQHATEEADAAERIQQHARQAYKAYHNAMHAFYGTYDYLFADS